MRGPSGTTGEHPATTQEALFTSTEGRVTSLATDRCGCVCTVQMEVRDVAHLQRTQRPVDWADREQEAPCVCHSFHSRKWRVGVLDFHAGETPDKTRRGVGVGPLPVTRKSTSCHPPGLSSKRSRRSRVCDNGLRRAVNGKQSTR